MEEIRDRAKERRKMYDVERSQGEDFESWQEAEADLDHAIAIASNKCGHPHCDKRYVHVYALGFALCEEHHEQTMAEIQMFVEAEKELNQARADVLKVRDIALLIDRYDDVMLMMAAPGDVEKILALTEPYEAYRGPATSPRPRTPEE